MKLFFRPFPLVDPFVTDLNHINSSTSKKDLADVTPGFYYWNGSEWIRMVAANETANNILYVGPTCRFPTIAAVISFLNTSMTGPTVIQLDGGNHAITETQTIDLAYPVTFQGISYGESTITGPDDGTTAFDAQTKCYFKMLAFESGTTPGIGIKLSGPTEYYEIKDATFTGFTKAVDITTNADLWLFETDFDDCTGAGVEIEAGSGSGGSLKVSECDFTNCATGINLFTGQDEIVSILNCTFYNSPNPATDIGVSYNPATTSPYFTYSSMFITNNAWNNQGSFFNGFDFARTDGRDANVFMSNNSGHENENPHCKLTLLNNPTGINANGTTWVKATWSTSPTFLTTYTSKWDLTTTLNKFVYLPDNKLDVVMWISGNVSSGNTARNMNIGICKGGNSATRYGETTVRTGNDPSRPSQFSMVILLSEVGPGNFFELWFNFSTGGTDNVIFSDLSWYVDSK